MKTFEQRKYMNAIITFVAKHYFSNEVVNKDSLVASSPVIDAAGGLFHDLIKDNDVLKEHLISTLTRSTIPVLDDSLSVRRSVVAALAKDHGKQCRNLGTSTLLTAIDKLHTLLESLIKLFGDSVYIRHTPVLQQEGK